MVSYKTNLMFALRKIVQCLWVNSVSQVGIEEDVELPRVILIMLEYATLQCHLKGPVSSLPLPHVGYYMCGTLVTHKQWPLISLKKAGNGNALEHEELIIHIYFQPSQHVLSVCILAGSVRHYFP